MVDPIVCFKVTGKDKTQLEDFYRALFDWQLTPADDNYKDVSPSAGINGGIGKAMDAGSGHITFYVEVASISNTLIMVEGHGGERLMEPVRMPKGPLIALFKDPEGRTVGLIEAGSMRAG